MALEIKLHQKLSQSLVMTPQLQQAIKLLQLGRMEYLEVLEKELLENPALEDVRDSADSGVVTQNSNSELDAINQFLGNADSESSNGGETGAATAPDTRLEYDPFRGGSAASDFDGGAEASYARSSGSRGDDDEERPSLEASFSRPEGLASHLLWQLRVSDCPAEDQNIASHVIGNLDRNGFLQCSLEEIAESASCPLEQAEQVLRTVQSLDPSGVGARDLSECLCIQLEQQGLGESLAGRIARTHLSKVELRRFDLIAKEENVLVEEVYEAMKLIQRLEPRPGRPFVDESPVYITPDIYVRKVGEEYVILLNEAGMPKLRLSPRYRELLASTNGKGSQDKEYLQDCLKSAAWLIKSIHQRQKTIYRVTESIMSFQKEFLEHGVSAMKPLVLRDVASDVGMHESTVSRVTTNKYVHTPQGVYELKFFFSSGLKSEQGEISSESVKQKILELVNAEDPRRPMSDQALVERLRADGIDIARRTVAKYREMLNILSSSRRKKIF